MGARQSLAQGVTNLCEPEGYFATPKSHEGQPVSNTLHPAINFLTRISLLKIFLMTLITSMRCQ